MINYSIKTWFIVLLEHGFALLATIEPYNIFLIDLIVIDSLVMVGVLLGHVIKHRKPMQ